MTEDNFSDLFFSVKNMYENKLKIIDNLESQVRVLTEQKEQADKCLKMVCELILSANWYKSDNIRLEDIDIQLLKDTRSILNM